VDRLFEVVTGDVGGAIRVSEWSRTELLNHL
jgi:hypothetical protein